MIHPRGDHTISNARRGAMTIPACMLQLPNLRRKAGSSHMPQVQGALGGSMGTGLPRMGYVPLGAARGGGKGGNPFRNDEPGGSRKGGSGGGSGGGGFKGTGDGGVGGGKAAKGGAGGKAAAKLALEPYISRPLQVTLLVSHPS